MTPPRFPPGFLRNIIPSSLLLGLLAATVFAAPPEKRRFAIPAGTADKSLQQFATQSGVEVIYPAEVVRDVPTPAVRGEMIPAEAVGRLLDGTGLASAQDGKTGAFSISRRNDPNDQRAAQKTPSDRPTGQESTKFPKNPRKS